MMHKLSAVIVIALALVVQGATLVEREGCPQADTTAPICETSPGSPNAIDCNQVLIQIRGSNQYIQSNRNGSHCTTIAKAGTCKVEACGQFDSRLLLGPGSTIGNGYLQTIRNRCLSGGRVGGRIYPLDCKVLHPGGVVPTDDNNRYHLQFSHI